jgi:hypothetical protein
MMKVHCSAHLRLFSLVRTVSRRNDANQKVGCKHPMNWRFRLVILAVPLAVFAVIQAVQAAQVPWGETVGPGIEYQVFQLPDPNNVYVARMDRDNPDVIIESSLAKGMVSGGVESVSGMASRYNQAINYWGQSWGSRNKVVVAINGSFYNIESGVPQGGLIHSGWYVRRYEDLGGGSGFVWNMDRTPMIGECVFHRPEKQLVTRVLTGASDWIDRVNEGRSPDKLVLFTPQYDWSTNTNDDGLEVLVEVTRPTMILPTPAGSHGFVREIRDGQGSTPIPFDHVVLSAHGSGRDLLDTLNIGDEIVISQEIKHYDTNCSTSNSRSWTKAYAGVGGSYLFLKNGAIKSFSDAGATYRHPRTAVAYNDDYIFFIVVDGRDDEVSIGMTIDELAVFTRDELGADWAVAQDGGGSSTMVINGVLVNDLPLPELNTVYIPIVAVNIPDGEQKATFNRFQERNSQTVEAQIDDGDPPPDDFFTDVPRSVANGLMMVVVEAMDQSSTFSPGDQVITTSLADVRLGPGSNYFGYADVEANINGVILEPLNQLNGVLARGKYWWKVDFGEMAGWVIEDALAAGSTP